MANSVVVNYEAKVAQFITDTHRAAKSHANAMNEMAAGALKVAKTLGLAFSAVAIVEGIKGFISSTAEATVELAHLHEKLGISAEALGGLRLAATESGVGMDQLGKMVTKVARIQLDASAGLKPAIAEMKFFGITAKDTADQAVNKLLKSFAEMPPSFQRAGVAAKVFGQRLGTDFLVMADKARDGLQGLIADAKRFGVSLDEGTLKAAEEYEKTMGLLKLQFTSVAEAITKDAMPAIEGLAKDLSDPAIRGGFKAMAEGAIYAMTTVITFAAEVSGAIKMVMENIAAARNGAAKGDILREQDELDRIEKRIKRLKENRGSYIGAAISMNTVDPEAKAQLEGTGLKAMFVPILPQEELKFLQQRYSILKTNLTADNKDIAAAAVAASKAAAEGAKAAKDATDGAAQSVAEWKKRYDEMLKGMGPTHAGKHGAGKAAGAAKVDPAAVAAASFQLKLDELSDTLNGPAGHAQRQYTQTIAEFNAIAEKAKGHIVDMSQATAVAAEIQKRADDALRANALGPVAQEAYRYAEELRNLNDLQQSGILNATQYAQAQKLVEDAHRRAEISAKRAADPYHAYLDDLTRANIELSKTVEERAADNFLRQQGIALNSPEAAGMKTQIEDRIKLNEQMQKSIQAQDQFRTQFGDAFTSIIDGSKSAKQAFHDLAKSILDDIARMVAEQWVKQLFGAQGQNGGGSAGGWMSAVASMFTGSANGNVFSGGNVVPFARGGIVSSPTIFPMASGGKTGLMGEAGPEAIMPLSRGRDGKLGVHMQGMRSGDVNINVVVNNDGTTSAASGDATQNARQFAHAIKGVVLKEIQQQQRPGGILWSRQVT